MYYGPTTVGDEKVRNLSRALIAFLMVSIASPAFAARFERFECRVADKVVETVPVDINRDGRLDLIVSYRRGFYPNAQGRIGVFVQSERGFTTAPQQDFPLPADACLFDVADIDRDGAAEFILFRKWQVQAIRLGVSGGQWVTILKKSSGAMFPPYDGELPYLHLVQDWHGNGAPVLALPDYGRLHLFGFGENWQVTALESLEIPVRGRIATLGTMPPGATDYAINSGLRTPNAFLSPIVNGARDLVLSYREELWFYRNQGGRLAAKAKPQFLPILNADERRRENVGLLVNVEDIDGDGRPDVMLNKVGGSLTSYHSRIQIHRGVDGGFEAQPGFAVDHPGFASQIRFWDLDGDHRKEMAVPMADIGLVQLARMLVNQSARVAVNVYQCRGAVGPGMYAAKPTITRNVTLKVDTDSGIYIIGFAPSFEGDFDGDGRPDLFMAHGDGFGVWRNLGQMRIADDLFASDTIAPSLSYKLLDVNNDRRSDVLVWNYLEPAKQGTIYVLLNRP